MSLLVPLNKQAEEIQTRFFLKKIFATQKFKPEYIKTPTTEKEKELIRKMSQIREVMS